MLILLEGATGTGKSTIAQHLVYTHGFETVHRLQPNGRHPLDWYTGVIRDYVPGFGKNLVLDRWHMSEWVYGPALRGRTDLSRNAYAAVDEMLLDKGCFMVYTHGLIRDIQAGMLERDGKQRFTDDQIASHVRRFEELLQITRLPYRPHMVRVQTPELTAEVAVSSARQLEGE